jgi:hypothetical protein
VWERSKEGEKERKTKGQKAAFLLTLVSRFPIQSVVAACHHARHDPLPEQRSRKSREKEARVERGDREQR